MLGQSNSKQKNVSGIFYRNHFFHVSDTKFSLKEEGEPKFDGSGYDKDLVEGLERDIVQKNPNVRW